MNRRTTTLCLLLCLVVPAAGSTLAQNETGARISLDQCRRIALANNLDLVAARKNPEISDKSVVVENSAFHPVLGANYSHSDAKDEVFNISQPDSQTTDLFNVRLDQTIKTGGSYSVIFTPFNRTESTGATITLDTAYSASWDMIYNQSLLRNRGKKAATEQLQLARGNAEISEQALRTEAHRVIEAAEGAYWDVAAAARALEVAQQSLKRAEDLLELNKKKVEVGTMAPIEITEARAEVASRLEEVIVAGVTLENNEDALLQLLAIPQEDPLWEMRLVLTDQPQFARIDVDVDDALDVALTNRPEIESAEWSLRNSELSEKAARNRVKPDLGFRLQLQPKGNNFVNTGMGPVSEGGWQEAVDEIFRQDVYFWSAGLSLSYPIGNKGAKANYAISTLNKQKAQVDLQNQEQTVRVEVRRAAREVESGTKRVEAAQLNVSLQEEKLNAEQKKFDNGLSTTFQVFQFQTDLFDAQLARIRAYVDYTKALIALDRVKGTLLEARGLSLSSADAP